MTATNIAGSISTTLSVIKQNDALLPGINVKMDDMDSFTCSYISRIYIYNTYSSIWTNLEGLNDVNADDTWNSNMDGVINNNSIDWFNATFTGYIYSETDGSFTFYHKNDYAIQNKIWINDELIFDTTSNCNSWDYEMSEMVSLSAGYNKFYMYILGSEVDSSYNAYRRFYLQYSQFSSSNRMPLSLYYSIFMIINS